jgi:alkylated DNA repair protein alkB family protein 1
LCRYAVDDAEHDLSKPIVSISLGCPAVFLLGGETRDTPPTAVLLRSGDAVVLAGESRRWYHGLPRVFTAVGLSKLRIRVPTA